MIGRLFSRGFRLLRVGRCRLLLLLRLPGHQLLASRTDVVLESAADVVRQASRLDQPAGRLDVGLDVLLGKSSQIACPGQDFLRRCYGGSVDCGLFRGGFDCLLGLLFLLRLLRLLGRRLFLGGLLGLLLRPAIAW